MKHDIEANISEIEKTIGYSFNDKSLLLQAFTRTSFCNEHNRNAAVKYSSNEVLEFFGDGVLSLAIITVLMSENTKRYKYGIETPLREGDFSNIKSKLSDKKNLSKSMSELGLQKYLKMGDGDEKLGIENEPSVMEDLFESIIGAIYIDCGMDMQTVIRSVKIMLDTSVYLARDSAFGQSAKNAVQEWCADKSRRLAPPRYETVREEGPEHKKCYTRVCIVDGEVVGTGVGKNCKIADAVAAERALEFLAEREKKCGRAPKPEMVGADKLRSYVAKQNLPQPIFKDCGECEGSDDYAKLYRFECTVGDLTCSATARSKNDARAMVCAKMMKMLKSR